MAATQHRVAHRAADEGDLVAGVGEASAEVVDHGADAVQLGGDRSLHLDHAEGGGLVVGHGGAVYARARGRPRGAGFPAAHPRPTRVVAWFSPVRCCLPARACAGSAEGSWRWSSPGWRERRGWPRRAAAAGPLAAPALAGTARAADETVEPLRVTIDALTPGELPRSGPLEVSGTVTNVDDDTWTTINLYPFLGGTALTTPAELSLARETDVLDFVGERVTDPGPYAVIDTLEPGESADYSFTVARSRLEVDERGVYWFGVHALGQGVDGPRPQRRRSRPHLPALRRRRGPQPPRLRGGAAAPPGPPRRRRPGGRARVVGRVPGARRQPRRPRRLRRRCRGPAADLARRPRRHRRRRTTGRRQPGALHDAHDRPARPRRTRRGRHGGPRLTRRRRDRRPRRGLAVHGRPDVRRLRGDGPRPGPVRAGHAARCRPASRTPTTWPSSTPRPATLALSAADWLDALQDAVGSGSQVLALPYGDLDVAAAARFAPEVYRSARRRSGSELEGVELSTQPALASPLGFLPVEALDDGPRGRDDPAHRPDARWSARRRPAARGGLGAWAARWCSPPPAPSTAARGRGRGSRPSALRQRILSEAAVRLLDTGRRSPLVVTLPLGWAPDTDPTAFFDALDTDWVDLDTVAEATAGRRPRPVAATELTYPTGTARRRARPGRPERGDRAGRGRADTSRTC